MNDEDQLKFRETWAKLRTDCQDYTIGELADDRRLILEGLTSFIGSMDENDQMQLFAHHNADNLVELYEYTSDILARSIMDRIRRICFPHMMQCSSCSDKYEADQLEDGMCTSCIGELERMEEADDVKQLRAAFDAGLRWASGRFVLGHNSDDMSDYGFKAFIDNLRKDDNGT